LGSSRSITWPSIGGSLERKAAGSGNPQAMNYLQHNDLKHVHARAIVNPLKQPPRFENSGAEVSHSTVRIDSDRSLRRACTNPASTCICSLRLIAKPFLLPDVSTSLWDGRLEKWANFQRQLCRISASVFVHLTMSMCALFRNS
jgi:hypothetical protein